MWMHSSGAEARMESNKGLYRRLLSEEHDTKLVETIELGERKWAVLNLVEKKRNRRHFCQLAGIAKLLLYLAPNRFEKEMKNSGNTGF